MSTIREVVSRGWLVAAGALLALTVARFDGPQVAAQEPPPTLYHSGRTFWLGIGQEEASRRAYQAARELGLTLDPVDATGRKWVMVSRKPGLYIGVSFVADSASNGLIDAGARRVLVSITAVCVQALNREAGEIRAFLDYYINNGKAPGGTQPPAGRESISMSKAVYEYPEALVVRWSGTPGHARDEWRIAGPNSPPSVVALSGYTGGQRDGEKTIQAAEYAYSGLRPKPGQAVDLEVRLVHGEDGRITQRYRFQIRDDE